MESWGLIDVKQIEKAGAWFDRNIISTVLAARFIPGMRLPTYVAAGALRVSSIRFLLVAVAASVVWTLALLALTIRFGEKVLTHTGPMKFYVGSALSPCWRSFNGRPPGIAQNRNPG